MLRAPPGALRLTAGGHHQCGHKACTTAVQATAAASDSRECLYELLQAAQEQLMAVPVPASGENSIPASKLTGAAADQPGLPLDASASSAAGDSVDVLTQVDSGPSRAGDMRLVVLKLDHMRDRRGYCR